MKVTWKAPSQITRPQPRFGGIFNNFALTEEVSARRPMTKPAPYESLKARLLEISGQRSASAVLHVGFTKVIEMLSGQTNTTDLLDFEKSASILADNKCDADIHATLQGYGMVEGRDYTYKSHEDAAKP